MDRGSCPVHAQSAGFVGTDLFDSLIGRPGKPANSLGGLVAKKAIHGGCGGISLANQRIKKREANVGTSGRLVHLKHFESENYFEISFDAECGFDARARRRRSSALNTQSLRVGFYGRIVVGLIKLELRRQRLAPKVVVKFIRVLRDSLSQPVGAMAPTRASKANSFSPSVTVFPFIANIADHSRYS